MNVLEQSFQNISSRWQGLEKKVFGEKNAPLNPLRLTVAGGVSTLSSLPLLTSSSPSVFAVGSVLYGLGTLADMYDGKFSRKYGLETKEGAILDPLVDKVKNVGIASTILISSGMHALENQSMASLSLFGALAFSYGINVGIDWKNHKLRGSTLHQLKETLPAVFFPDRAQYQTEKTFLNSVNPGKYKAAIQVLAPPVYFLGSFFFEHKELFHQFNEGLLAGVIGVASYLGWKSYSEKKKKKEVTQL
jgi:phosphatidylglycerophosphate synthase